MDNATVCSVKILMLLAIFILFDTFNVEVRSSSGPDYFILHS
jgi:hypothetical protein